MIEPERIALYGTLMRSFGRQARLGVARMLRFERRCVIRGLLFDLGPYPGLIAGQGRVEAELYRVRDSAALKVLDEFEGSAPPFGPRALFVRRRVRLLEPRVEAWAYFFNRSARGAARIFSGSYQHAVFEGSVGPPRV